jgi:hypothetical protein
MPSLTYVGFGAGVTTSDVRGRATVTAFPTRTPESLRLEAGLGIGRYLGVGLAFIPFPEIAANHNIGRVPVTDRQREQAWLGEVRGRMMATTRVAVDVVAGGGVLRQQREGSYQVATCGPSCFTTVTAEPSRSSPVFTAGIDVPVRLGRHAGLAVVGRTLWMRRGLLDVSSWPRDDSTEYAAFVTLRITR